jgi:hypothetical protein
MTINVNAQSLKNRINAANPNQLPQELQILRYGDVLRAGTTFRRRFNPDTAPANASQLATLDTMALNDDAKAATILRAYARATAAAGTLGELAVQAFGATPIDGQIAVAPNGDIVVLAASRYTDIDVVYQPDKVDLTEITLTVVANVLTIPAGLTATGVVALLEAIATIGGSLGSKIILVPGAGAPAAGQCRLNLAKTTVTFAAADAVTQATVKLALVAAVDVDALLTANATVQ